MTNLIEVKQVTKRFKEGLFRKKTVLDNINLTVCEGDFMVMRGVNGSGKSTLLRIILGLQEPDRGSVKLFDQSPRLSSSKLQVGTVFQEVTPPNSLKVKELISLVGSYYPNSISTEEAIEKFGLTDKQNAFPSDLAGGQKQRLYFALALIGRPKLLVLDEPTKNLDIEGQEVFWQQLEEYYNQGGTILMVTHIKSDQDRLQLLANKIVTLSDAQLSFDKQEAPNHQNQETSSENLQKINPSKILIKQTQAEILQLLRNPIYLLGVILFSGLISLIPIDNVDQVLKLTITSFGAVSLLIFAIERLGKRVAIERVEGWLKLLRVTPLPPNIYIMSKLLMTMVVLIVSLLTIFSIGIFKFGLEQSVSSWLTLSIGLLTITTPFIALGVALGYLVKPKALDSITGLLIPLGAVSSGLIPFDNPSYIQDLLVLSPFFHYRELVLFLGEADYDNQLILHVVWLAFYGVVAGTVAKYAYQRDSLSQ